jgi:hypothetical protein
MTLCTVHDSNVSNNGRTRPEKIIIAVQGHDLIVVEAQRRMSCCF